MRRKPMRPRVTRPTSTNATPIRATYIRANAGTPAPANAALTAYAGHAIVGYNTP
jgi:hypothetical protein